jgi:hypothetical protein
LGSSCTGMPSAHQPTVRRSCTGSLQAQQPPPPLTAHLTRNFCLLILYLRHDQVRQRRAL